MDSSNPNQSSPPTKETAVAAVAAAAATTAAPSSSHSSSSVANCQKLAQIILESKYFRLIDPLMISIRAAQDKRVSESREFFEQLIGDYPTCGRFWKIYIEQELRYKNYDRVEKLFQRSLIKVLNIELWKYYLTYVKDTKAKMSNYKEKMAQAYDLALEKIGLDVQSYNIWNDYVNFLKSVEAVGTFAENQKITAIRKVYQRGVMNPMINVEQLWKDYCAYENQISQVIAKRMIEDRSREAVVVRKIAKEYENVTKHLDRYSPSELPQGTSDELRQKAYWRKYIEWEKNNPLKSEDYSQVCKRVMFAYEQYILSYSWHSDVYYDAAAYLQQLSALMIEKCDVPMSKHYREEAITFYERAIKTFMKKSMLIYFAYADFEESLSNYEKVGQIYDRYIDIKDVDPSLCYIQYMRFLRRAEGIRSARAVFKRAREDPRTSYHVFIAAASMEYLCTKDITIAFKIYQLGYTKYGHIAEFVLSFIEFIKHINDAKIMRSFIQTVINDNHLPKERIGEIWSEWFNYENDVGSIQDIVNVENKLDSIYNTTQFELDEKQTLFLVDRFKFMNLYPCSNEELRSIGYFDANNIPTGAHYFNKSELTASTTTVINAQQQPSVNSAMLSSSTLSTPTVPPSTNGQHHHRGGGRFRRGRQNNQAAATTADRSKTTDRMGNIVRSLADLYLNEELVNLTNYDLPTPFYQINKKRPAYTMPDPNKMNPFKPNTNAFTSLQSIPGGGLFLFPSVIADLIKRLPHPMCFDGPYVAIDEFLDKFANLDLKEDFQTYYEEIYVKMEMLDKKNSASSSSQIGQAHASRFARLYEPKQSMAALKRNLMIEREQQEKDQQQQENGADGEKIEANTDIYKQRQQRKLLKQQ